MSAEIKQNTNSFHNLKTRVLISDRAHNKKNCGIVNTKTLLRVV